MSTLASRPTMWHGTFPSVVTTILLLGRCRKNYRNMDTDKWSPTPIRREVRMCWSWLYDRNVPLLAGNEWLFLRAFITGSCKSRSEIIPPLSRPGEVLLCRFHSSAVRESFAAVTAVPKLNEEARVARFYLSFFQHCGLHPGLKNRG